LSLSVYLWPFSLYLSCDTKFAGRTAATLVRFSNRFGTQRRYPGNERELRVALSREDHAVTWNFWLENSSWYSDDPKWRRGRWSPVDALLGQQQYSNEVLSTHDVVIPMPEKAYPATVTLQRATWRRTRFPFLAKSIDRANIDVPGGIPHEGKGENAWDCGEDATYSMTCPAGGLAEAIGKMVESVTRDRLRYGGSIYHRREEPAAA
jgi:hypothetical protein